MESRVNLAVIPARGGSKRIPNKNIKDFLGRPVIEYPIEAALRSGLFRDLIVTTDSREIADIASGAGASVPFMRGAELSGDYVMVADVIMDALDRYEEAEHIKVDNICVIFPAAVFVTERKIAEGFSLLSEDGVNSVLPVVPFSYPPQRGVVASADGGLVMKWPENYDKRSQDLEAIYHDTGQFYWLCAEKFRSDKKLFLDKMKGVFVSPLEVQDIDSLDDWKIAEMKYRLLKCGE